LISNYDNAISVEYVNKKNQRRLWDTLKNIEAVEKWALKKEEPEKKTRKNKKWTILARLKS
tara:strand:- start:571 stop:753 length:183 start_codon:yes stop_codon:yes gene_type:complete